MPAPRTPTAGEGQAPPLLRFVVQQHDEGRVHFDFRLEVDGVLVSWNVPLGPSLDPTEKRLATQSEDRPLDYVDIEGRAVWDAGHYENRTERDGRPVDLRDAIEDGYVVITLHGDRLRGDFMMVHRGLRGGQRAWLMSKI